MVSPSPRAALRATVLLLLGASMLSACARGASTTPAERSERALLPPAPWSEPSLAASAIPPIYVTVWRAAENRSTCALLAPERLDPVLQQTAAPRAATFSGGWAVAYDTPQTRSAFGVAGTGSRAWEAGIYDAWPERRILSDSSRVGYGPEGGTGPNWLAYVRIPGQDCLYNVWSRRGQAHLEELLGQLRFVEVR